MKFNVVIEYSNEKLNREILSKHICDIINQNETNKEDYGKYETEKNSSVA